MAKACAVALVARFAVDAFVPMGFGRTASPACHTENRFECMELESEWFGGKA